MLLDPQVRSSLVTFVNAVLADGLHVRPRVEDKDDPDYDDAKELAEFGEHCLEYPERPVDLCVTEQLYVAGGWGNQLAEVVTEPGSGRWAGWDVLGRYKPLPRHAYALVVNGFGTLVGARVLKPGEPALPWQGPAAAADLADVLPLEKFTLLAWMPEAGDPRGTNLLDPVYRPWWHKRMTQEDSVKFIARFGQPWVFVTPPEGAVAQTPADELGNPTGDPAQSAVDQYVARATEMYSGGVFGGAHGSTFQLVTSTSEGRAFWTKIEACNREITLGILGSTRMTMEAEHGSKADSQTAQDVSGLRVKYAKRLVAVALSGLLYNLVKWNRGKAVADKLAPRVTLNPTEQQDWSERATAAAAIGYALDASQLPGVDEELGMPPRAPAPLTGVSPVGPLGQEPPPPGVNVVTPGVPGFPAGGAAP
jgi:hypothetical protein